MDITKEAQRLASLATVFVWIGWIGVAWALIAGVLWWSALVQKVALNFLAAFALSWAAIGEPLFGAIALAAFGQALRMFAISNFSRNQ